MYRYIVKRLLLAVPTRDLANLQSGQPVQMDSDGDGKPDQPLTDTERSNQMELARSTLKAYNCTETAAAG